MVAVVIILFSSFALDSILVMNFVNADVADIQRLMQARFEAGHVDLGWHGGARGEIEPLLVTFAALRNITVIGGYIGGLIFFFHQRHVGRAQ